MKVERIADWSILQYFWPALSDDRSWKPKFCHFESGRFTQVLLYKYKYIRKRVWLGRVSNSRAHYWSPWTSIRA